MQACAIISCPASRFKFKYKENMTSCKRLKRRISGQIEVMYQNDVRSFYVSGTLGVGIWGGELVLQMAQQPEYTDVELRVILPFENNDRNWDPHNQARLAHLRRNSTQTSVLGKGACTSHKRIFDYMIDCSDCVLAVCEDIPEAGEVHRAVCRARRKNLPVTLIHPDTGAVTSGF